MLIVAVLILLVSAESPSSKRSKRVLNGVPVAGRDTGYSAVRYYGAIVTRHGTPRSTSRLEKVPAVKIRCSGALLTPGIIQTACHCVSSWNHKDKSAIRPPILDYHWENVVVVYVGVNDELGNKNSMTTVKPLSSNMFLVHMKCGQLSKGKELNVHDFGWIRVNSNWLSEKSGVPLKALDFAPVYSKSQVGELYLSAMANQLVCLHLGFGVYNAQRPKERSHVLRHGWGVLTNLQECYKLLSENLSKAQIESEASWFCSINFRYHNQPTGKGDSGSPVSCDNHYVAVALGRVVTKFRVIRRFDGPSTVEEEYMSVHAPLFFAIYQNSAEYRRAFIYYLANYEKVTYVEAIKKYGTKKLRSH